MPEIKPFSYSETVTSQLFIGREELINNLLVNISACENTITYGHRKVGKSSLVLEAIRQFSKKSKNQKHLFLIMDMTRCNSVQEFISILCTELHKLIEQVKPLKTKFKKLSDFIGSIRPLVKMNTVTGEVEHYMDFVGEKTNILSTISEAMGLLESISKDYKITVVLDEFQNIALWQDGNEFQWKLRSFIQHQKKIAYIFLGSSRKLISQIFLESKSAFYRSGVLLHVDNFIDPLIFGEWIQKQFLSAGMDIEGAALKHILDVTKAHPYHTQKLCYQLWMHKSGEGKSKRTAITIDHQEVVKLTGKLIRNEDIIYQERVHKLKQAQKLVLYAIAQLEDGETLFQNRVKKKFSLPAANGTILHALSSLENENVPLIYKDQERYVVEDPFFELWLKQ